MKKLILIDGNSLLFRAYFAMRPMVTSDGQHTQGVFAFVNMLNKIIKDYEPDYIAVAFDMKEKTFRHEYYPEYKAGRLKTPLELLSEIPLMHEVLEAKNIKIFEMPKYEADDLIGTIASRASSDGLKTIIISGDKDELQLIDENTNVLINKKGMSEFQVYDIDEMKARYNLSPQQFIDLKGLMGDKSDNIPGIAGVGEKKGIALLEEYGSLECILEHADEIKGKLGETVRDSKDVALLSKKLATIDTNAPLEFDWTELEYKQPDLMKLIDVYTRLEFNSFIVKLKNQYSEELQDGDINTSSKDLELVSDDIKEISYEELIKRSTPGSELVVEIVGEESHLMLPEPTELLVICPEIKSYSRYELTAMNTQSALKKLSEGKYKLISHDIKKLLYIAAAYDVDDIIPYYDIMIAEYLIDPNRKNYDLSKMLLKHCSYVLNEEIVPGIKSLLFVYNIYCSQRQELVKLELIELFDKIEMPLTRTISCMEHEGIKVDRTTLENIGLEIDTRVIELQTEIFKIAGIEFNINSPKKLAEVLFDKMDIPYPKQRPKTGSLSTAADILELLEDDYPIVKAIMEYRKLVKLKGTYVDGLIPLISDDGKIHPHFMQTVAATGRLSCTEPNLQNIPIRDDYGRLIRKAFIVSQEGNIFTGSDYSQIELRIMADLSGDEVLINAFNEDMDIHRLTASRVFDIPFDEVSSLDRSKAKAVNFGVIYGMSGFGLSENLKISRAEAQSYIKEYFEKHAKVKAFLDKMVQEGEDNRMVRTSYGRLRQIPEFASRKFMEREFAKRLAMNTPIQGTAADIIKIAMNKVFDELKERNLKSKLILQIHDELIIEGPASEADEVKQLLNDCMNSAANMKVELKCDIHSADCWYDLK